MRKLFIVLLLLAVSVYTAWAGDRVGWDGMPAQEIRRDQPLNKTHHFLTASGLLLLATVYDVEMTFRAGKHGAREGNAWARDWVEKGKVETYAYSMGINLVTMGISYALFRSKNPDSQKYWIVLPIIGIAGHTIGGTLNLCYTW